MLEKISGRMKGGKKGGRRAGEWEVLSLAGLCGGEGRGGGSYAIVCLFGRKKGGADGCVYRSGLVYETKRGREREGGEGETNGMALLGHNAWTELGC